MNKLHILLSTSLLLLLTSCSDVHMTLPLSPKGDRGISAYETWKQQVTDGSITWDKDKVAVVDYFKYLKSTDGQGGVDGKSAYELWLEALTTADGVADPHRPEEKWDPAKNRLSDYWRYLTGGTGERGGEPYVGDNGHWWIGDWDSGKEARGTRALPPTVKITTEGNWMINGQDTGKRAPVDGANGLPGRAPHISVSEQGTWIIGDEVTTIAAKGTDGKTFEVAIGNDNYWYIDGTKTPILAFAQDGKDGADGTDVTTVSKSAFELWQEAIADGTMPDPRQPWELWPAERNSRADFFDFYAGRQVVPEDNGKPGEIGQPGEPVIIIDGAYNVIAQYSNAQYSEYVRPADGSVLYRVYDELGRIAPGVTVRKLPGVDPSLSFTTDKNGLFSLPAEALPSIQSVDERLGAVEILTADGKTTESATNTYVPNKVMLKLGIANADTDMSPFTITGEAVKLHLTMYRKLNPEDEWAVLPKYIDYSGTTRAFRVSDKENPKSRMATGMDFFFEHELKIEVSEIAITRPVVWDKIPLTDDTALIDDCLYYSFEILDPYYGTTAEMEDVTIPVPAVYPFPTIKSATIHNGSDSNGAFLFESVSLTFNYSGFDMSKVVNGFERKVSPSGTYYYDLKYLPEHEARAMKNIQLVFYGTLPNGTSYRVLSPTSVSADEPTISTSGVYLGSGIILNEYGASDYFYSKKATYRIVERKEGFGYTILVDEMSDLDDVTYISE